MCRCGQDAPDVYLTVAEVAGRLRVTTRAVKKWLAGVRVNGSEVRLGCVRAGGVVRVRESDLAAFQEASDRARRGEHIPPPPPTTAQRRAEERRRQRSKEEFLAKYGG